MLHFDADWQNPRALTVLHYLDDGRGSTWFPLAITDDGRREEGGGCTGGWHPQTKEEAVAACEGGGGLDPASDGLRISPRTGDAIAVRSCAQCCSAPQPAGRAGEGDVEPFKLVIPMPAVACCTRALVAQRDRPSTRRL